MKWLDLTLDALEANLALDEALLLEAEEALPLTHEVLRLWEWPTPAVVLGAGCALADDVDEEACLRDIVPIARRSSGGGTVLLGPGCLLYTLILSCERDPALGEINPSYRYILSRLAAALGDLAPEIHHAGTSDLASSTCKFSGSAQQRKRRYMLHHGTLLYDFDFAGMSRYLKMPARQPEYRGGRPHSDFLVNLQTARADLARRLCTLWNADEKSSAWPRHATEKLVAEKFATDAWLRRR